MCKRLLILTSFLLVFGLVVNASGQPTGEIMYEVWDNIGGTLTTDLTNNAAYPDNPTSSELLSAFEGPVAGDEHNNFGGRIHGYLYPATSGDYTFWIASDDSSDLWLSTDDDPANAVVICGVDGWCGSRQFDGEGGSPGTRQMSAPVALEGGQKYYISAIYKEGGGGDNCAVAWQGPDSPDRAVIDGAFLSPAAWAPSAMKAKNPAPADGAVDADVALLEWEAGAMAVSHAVYLNGELIAETDMTLAAATLDAGASYTWRVDEVLADGTVTEGDTWSFTTLPFEAHFPSPADGAEDVESAKLTWTVGKNTIINDVYFGTDEALVAGRDPSTFKGKLMTPSYDPGALELFTTYYWAVDEFSPTGTVAGPVWSFSTPKETIIDSGSKTLNYDNSVEPYVSELAYDVPADMTAEGVVSDLTLTFQGQAANLSVDEATGTYQVTGEGADIWGGSDAFHYVYMTLNGDGEISARVVSNGTGSNTWAKGGVMIRETTAANSKHMIMGMTGGDGGGIAFQGRFADAGANSSSLHGDVTASPPYWVKLVREGNNISGYASADGETWDLFADTSPDNSGGSISNPQAVEMADPVLIGLFVTSHADGENRTYTFDNVSIAGDVDGVLVSQDIASVSGNSAEPIYVALEDAAGNVASVTHPYPAATQITSPRFWRIPLSKFEGVDVTAAAKLYVGVGDGAPSGAGAVTISNIRVVKGESAGNIIWVDGDYDDNGDGAVDDLEWVAILTAAGYSVDNSDAYLELDDAKIAALNAADLVIISRNSNSGDYDEGDEPTQWNSITTPMIVMTAYNVRNSRWKMIDTGSQIAGMAPVMELADGTAVVAIDDTVGLSSFPDIEAVGNGTILATGDGLPWIVEWEAGVEYYDGAGQIAGGPRMFFAAGTQEDTAAVPPIGRGEMNLTPEGLAIYLAMVDDMIPAKIGDITVPTDIIKGIPDDGDWPGAEHPALAFDNNVNTKYLHFKGDFAPDPGTGGSGLKITPLDGASIVTGLALTTANDVPGRDPIAFELSGSNDSIDGPFTLIAAGDIVDFAGEAEWPRFTKNETPITFDNATSYTHYQLIFTAIRGPVGGSVNSMQIAEVELLGVLGESAAPPTIAWVSYHGADDEPHADAAAFGFTQAPDIEYTDLLKAQGYNVVRVLTTQEPDVEFLNTMDLVIISRTASSGHYSGSGATAWNSVTAPMINLNGYTLRSSRLGFTDGTDMPDTTGDIRLAVTDPGHPIFAGIALTDGVMDNPFAEGAVPLTTDETILSRGISINNNTLDEEGTVLATIAEVSADTGPVGGMVIAELPAGAVMQNSSGSPDDVLGGPRLVFLTGSREPSGVTGGQAAALYDLYEDGTQMFLNAVAYMLQQ